MAVSLTLLSGCGSYGNRNSTEGTVNTVLITDSIQSDETTEWEPTTYETVNNFPSVTMTIKKASVSSTGLTIEFKNNSGNQCIYGEYFLLEKKINERWYQVPVSIDDNYAFHDIGYNLDSMNDGEWKIDWNWLYGSLDTGEYRIVKDIVDFRNTGNYDKYYLTAEFTVH